MSHLVEESANEDRMQLEHMHTVSFAYMHKTRDHLLCYTALADQSTSYRWCLLGRLVGWHLSKTTLCCFSLEISQNVTTSTFVHNHGCTCISSTAAEPAFGYRDVPDIKFSPGLLSISITRAQCTKLVLISSTRIL